MLVFTPMKKHIYWSGEVTLHSCHTQHNNSIIITLWESIKFVFATFLRPHLSTQLFVSESSERTQPPLASLSQAWFPDHSRSGSHDPAITSQRRGYSLKIHHSKGVFTYWSLWPSVTSDVPHQWPCLPPQVLITRPLMCGDQAGVCTVHHWHQSLCLTASWVQPPVTSANQSSVLWQRPIESRENMGGIVATMHGTPLSI